MPKQLKKQPPTKASPKLPDPLLVDPGTGNPADVISAYMSALGRKGGQVSGAKRMENLTDKQRRDIAMKAAKARWSAKKR
jgi:hypothetical protein